MYSLDQSQTSMSKSHQILSSHQNIIYQWPLVMVDCFHFRTCCEDLIGPHWHPRHLLETSYVFILHCNPIRPRPDLMPEKLSRALKSAALQTILDGSSPVSPTNSSGSEYTPSVPTASDLYTPMVALSTASDVGGAGGSQKQYASMSGILPAMAPTQSTLNTPKCCYRDATIPMRVWIDNVDIAVVGCIIIVRIQLPIPSSLEVSRLTNLLMTPRFAPLYVIEQKPVPKLLLSAEMIQGDMLHRRSHRSLALYAVQLQPQVLSALLKSS